MPDDFHNISFDDWLDILCNYALLLAKQGNKKKCFWTLDKVAESNVYLYRKYSMYRIEICRLGQSNSRIYLGMLVLTGNVACGLALDDPEQVCYAVKYLIKEYPFCSDLFRLYSFANRLCSESIGYNTAGGQKTFLRYIKAMDFALLSPKDREWWRFNTNDRSNWMRRIFNEGLLESIKGHDPTIFGMYGHVLMSGGAYISAMNYYFRAYTITPEDPMLNLCLGLCYIQHAQKRQSENRQFQIQQGLSFVFRYYDLRTEANIAVYKQEAEFNVGRVWHALGLTHLAIPAYERCIQLSNRVREEHDRIGNEGGKEDFATEAAFAIQTILAVAGDFEGARKITEDVLVIE